MYLNLRVEIEPEATREIEDYVRIKLPELINEAIFEDKNALNKLIKECVKGQFRQQINEILQSKDYRNFLRDKVMQELGMEEKKVDVGFWDQNGYYKEDYQVVEDTEV